MTEGNKSDGLLNVKSIYNSPKVKGIKDFLSILAEEDIFSISQTASAKKISPQNREEAVDTILIFTTDIERFFSYRRITSHLLIQYLHLNHQTIEGHATRHQLISKVYKLWAEKFPSDIHENQSEEKHRVDNEEIPTNGSKVRIKHYIRSDEFAHDFAEWFYSCLNNVHCKSSSPQRNNLHSTMFCANASVDLFIANFSQSNDVHSEGAEECEKVLHDVVQLYNLYFTPNLKNGTQAVESIHGLVKVLSCGSLHKNNSFIGVFEQEFGLVQSPIDKNWKIFYTKANFKSSLTEVPALPPCTVFEIESEC